jgi:prepilin peptidase CpaA
VGNNLILIVPVVAFTLVAAVCDYRTKKLPNWLTVPAFAIGLLYHIIHGAVVGGFAGAWSEFLFSMGGFATGFGILFVLWLIGGGGAGDVKMMGALGAWLGPILTLYVFIISTIFVVFASAAALAYHMIAGGMGYTRRRFLNHQNTDNLPKDAALRAEAERKHRARRRLMPYGVPVAFATWTVLIVQFVRMAN